MSHPPIAMGPQGLRPLPPPLPTPEPNADSPDRAGPTAGNAVPVPPPPPPRSALPPVRTPEIGEPRIVSGVGSAKGVRWKGEIDSIETADHTGDGDQDGEAEGAVLGSDRDPLTRFAPPWLISTIVHLVLLLVLAVISTPAGRGLSRVMLTIGESMRESPVELSEFSIDANDSIEEMSETLEDNPVDVDIPTIYEVTEPFELTEEVPMMVGEGPPITINKPMFSGRSGAMKQALLAMYGGTKETQDAVARGLQWLKRNQERSGSWSMRGPYSNGSTSENRVAATAMAVLAFLGDGQTHVTGEYTQEVDRALRYLVGTQSRNGEFIDGNPRNDEKAYAQAQATIAVCEAYAMSGDSWLRGPAQLGLDYAMWGQSRQGGWRYQPRQDSDLSVTGWYVMALKSGKSAGLNVNSSTLDNVGHFLDTVQSYEGAAYGYTPGRAPSDAMTAEGLLCRMYLGWDKSHIAILRGTEALAYDYNFKIDEPDVYYWYYATQVLHHYGAKPWRIWNETMRKELPDAQIIRGNESGSWAPQRDKWGGQVGRLYTTCLSIYCLEVYYRHMPLYAMSNEKE